MTQPTHTHMTQGGRFVEVSEHAGSGPLEGQRLVVYHDLDKDVMSATTREDWRVHWKPVTPDTCTVCMGTGRDAIKGNKANPCGGCYGLGRVREDGETPTELWELADVAGRVIGNWRQQLAEHKAREALPGVAEAIQAALTAEIGRRQDAQAEQERKWRDGRGHGPGGARYTGD